MSLAPVVDRVRSLLPDGGRVLDAGCGDGALTVALTDAGLVTAGVDTDLDAMRPVSEERPKIPFYLDDLTASELPMGLVGRGFDVVVVRSAVAGWSLGELDAALATCARFAAPEGRLLAVVPAGSIGTFVRTAAKARWVEVSRGDWSGAPVADGDDVVVELAREPEKKPSRLRSLLRR